MSIFTRYIPRLYLITLLVTTILLAPAPAIGQVLEEIIVTAQRREQSLQDVPIAIDVYAADTLQKEGFDNLEELSAVITPRCSGWTLRT